MQQFSKWIIGVKKGIAENDFLVENINKWLQDNYEILVKEEFFNMHL